MQTLRPLLLVGLGGALGSISRYLLGGWVQCLSPFAAFPLGTLLVNLTGCFLIGLLGGLIDSRQLFGPDVRAFLLVGVLGGYTTFSSFTYETLTLMRDAEMLRALVNVGVSVIAGLVLTWLGYWLGRG